MVQGTPAGKLWVHGSDHAPCGSLPLTVMADALLLNLWFPTFTASEMMPRTLSVLRQFPFSASQPGISYLAIHPVAWGEPTVLERRFRPGLEPESAMAIAAEFLHSDYAYVWETHWDLWMPGDSDSEDFHLAPVQVKIITHGLDFEEHAYQQAGHLQVDFGLDTSFLGEEELLAATTEGRVRANVQRLVAFTGAVEKNCGITGRVLWSESDENLAQKLIELLQRVQ